MTPTQPGVDHPALAAQAKVFAEAVTTDSPQAELDAYGQLVGACGAAGFDIDPTS